jgi:hypothetical protein
MRMTALVETGLLPPTGLLHARLRTDGAPLQTVIEKPLGGRGGSVSINPSELAPPVS